MANDGDIEIGDIVTIVHTKGYFVVEAIEFKTNRYLTNGETVNVRMIMRDSGKDIRSKTTRSYRIDYCTKITEEIISDNRAKDNNKWDKILRAINSGADIEPEVKMSVNKCLKESGFLKELEAPPSLSDNK